jgi:hypothetical protein
MRVEDRLVLMFEAKIVHGLGNMIVLSTSMIMIMIIISIGEVVGPADAVRSIVRSIVRSTR